ncbi:predicted protein [Histoplasma mississippiense (nom. inval.)]|uniref:predicted protein n=1 Tax=Ajellomyces capsulatus (strain NAm1 / WU24) TaxID=2059318 RepID=UPI000157B9B9|nr:predicted protein [Histoplasma mississippiense (nom. inval.)]EDN03372.1 predicted protein [Histoplasma mississippiense (nom. inval.)]
MSNIPPSGNMADPDHMLEFQKLSNHYEPDLQGPLVGPKQSSSMITSEYANADSIYVVKTTELARLKSFNKLLNSAGCQEHLYEMFVDATEELLNQISQEIGKGSFDDTFLFNAFNDEYNSSSLIMHFRLMTSAWMKLNSSRYTDFLGVSVGEYCEKTIETVKTEIDEVGLQGLFDGVIEGSGLAIEILYLDRSEGTEVTPHLLSPNSPIATIRLLYRPGHYDLLYQTDQTRHDQGLTSVNFQYAMSSDYLPWYSSALPFDLNPVLMSIPSLPLNTSSISPQAPSSQPYTFSGRHIDPTFHSGGFPVSTSSLATLFNLQFSSLLQILHTSTILISSLPNGIRTRSISNKLGLLYPTDEEVALP